MIIPFSGDLILPPRCLAVFVDDTGHEALLPDHPVYGLGGCAVIARDLPRLISKPWRAIRERVTGSSDIPLHARKFSSIAKPSDIEAVAEFFRLQHFVRFGAIISTATKMDGKMDVLQTMKEVFQGRVNEIVETTLCREVKIIFEASQRADKLIEERFKYLSFRRGYKNIPVECYFMPKSCAEPALEVADFVMHAIGRQVRQNLNGRGRFVPDFCAVFHSVDQRYVSFIEVDTFTAA